MEKITHEIETRRDGIKIVRNYFVHEKAKDYFKLSHSEFTKDERKIAKFKHKKNG